MSASGIGDNCQAGVNIMRLCSMTNANWRLLAPL